MYCKYTPNENFKLTLTALGITKINTIGGYITVIHDWEDNVNNQVCQMPTKILKPTITYNEKQKVVVIYNIGKEVIKIQCDKQDKFDLRVGVGLAISKWLNCKKYKVLRTKFFRKDKNLDYKKYAEFILLDYFCYDEKKVEKFIDELKNEGRKFL